MSRWVSGSYWTMRENRDGWAVKSQWKSRLTVAELIAHKSTAFETSPLWGEFGIENSMSDFGLSCCIHVMLRTNSVTVNDRRVRSKDRGWWKAFFATTEPNIMKNSFIVTQPNARTFWGVETRKLYARFVRCWWKQPLLSIKHQAAVRSRGRALMVDDQDCYLLWHCVIFNGLYHNIAAYKFMGRTLTQTA